MENFDPIDISFLLNKDKVAADSAAIKADIMGVAETAESSVEKTNTKLQKVFSERQTSEKKHAQVLKTVSDKYKGILADGLTTFDGLTKKEQTLVVQYHNTTEALQSVKLAQKELNVTFEKGKIGAMDYTQAQAALGIEEAKLKTEIKAVDAAMQKSNTTLSKQGKLVKSAKPQWNGLNNSINQLSREMPAFAVSAQTGFLAISNNIPILADEISRLKYQNDALIASGEKAQPVWKKIAKGIFSFNTAMSIGIVLLTIYGKNLVNWIQTVFKGKEALDKLKKSQESLSKAFESTGYKKIITGLIQVRSYIDLAKKGFLDKTIAVEKYNEILGTALGKVNDIATAEKNLNEKSTCLCKSNAL